MIKSFLFFLIPFIIMTLPSYAADNFLEFGDVDFGRDFKEKSKWIFKTGAEYIKFPSALPEFDGKHETVKKGEIGELNGHTLSIGRDFYISNGVSTALYITGIYSKTLDKVIGKAAEDIDFDLAETRTAHQLAAYEASVSINYIFDYKIVDIQPFIEFGAGAGSVEVEKQYSRLNITDLETNGDEEYDVSTKEEFAFSRISLGVNLISYKGLMSYLKVSSMQMLKTSRETEGVIKEFGTTTITDVSSKEKDLSETEMVTMVSVGLGMYF